MTRQLARAFAAFCVLGAMFFGAGAARATDIPPGEEKAIRAVVQAQLDAFARDDAKRAFSYATPGLREMFGTPEFFMRMVRGSYPVVYRPATTAFMKPELQDNEYVQRVQMTDAEGHPWLAIYKLEQQKDKSWRIAGCVAVQNKGRVA